MSSPRSPRPSLTSPLTSRCLARCLTIGVLAAGLFGGSLPAHATYPGTTGGRLAFSISLNGNVDIYSVLPNGQDLRRLTSAPSFDACPSWSPDGKEIAFCSDRSGASEIWTMKANGTQPQQLTHLDGFMNFPNFSPDGHKIAFDGSLPNDTNNIFVINTDGSGLIQLTHSGGGTPCTAPPCGDLFPRWSPDGREIAFISTRTGTGQVWVMHADGNDQAQLTFDAAPKGQLPDWKPDGTQIAYNAGADIFVMNADGSSQRQITTAGNTAADIGPVWSPDGTQIAFLHGLGTVERYLYVMDADGSDPHPVHPGGIQFVPSWQSRGDD